MTTVHLRCLGTLCALFALAACENYQGYEERIGIFSRTDYQSEIDAIEDKIPPAGDLSELGLVGTVRPAAATDAAARDGSVEPSLARDVSTTGPGIAPRVRVQTEAETDPSSRVPVRSAELPPRTRIAPPGGFARQKRIIYGANRGPFRSSGIRTLR